MQSVLDQSQMRSLSSMTARNFTIPDPLVMSSGRSLKLRPSVRTIDEATFG